MNYHDPRLACRHILYRPTAVFTEMVSNSIVTLLNIKTKTVPLNVKEKSLLKNYFNSFIASSIFTTKLNSDCLSEFLSASVLPMKFL